MKHILEKDYSGRNGKGSKFISVLMYILFISVLMYVKSNQLSPSLFHSFLTVSFSFPAGLPSPPEKFIAGILGIICLVLMSTVETMITVTPCKYIF